LEVLKGEYFIATRVAMKLPFEPLSFRKSDRGGFPKAIAGFRKVLINGDPREVQCALTILRQYTQIRLSPNFDVRSITEPGVEIDNFRKCFTP